MVDRDRLNEELRHMRRLIESDPQVKAKFDLDGNGVIDGFEWDQVRQLVVKRLERQEAEAREGERLAATADPADLTDLATPVASGIGVVAQQIFQQDLPQPQQAGPAGGVTSLADLDEIVLEQQGLLSQLAGDLMRREFVIHGVDGQQVGAIKQVENEALQNLSAPLLERPDLNFNVDDQLAARRLRFTRSTEFVRGNSMAVVDDAGMILATTSWVFSLLRRTYEVTPTGESAKFKVRRPILRPWTMQILDSFDEQIGVMERGWSGLGFLTGANLTRVRLNPGAGGPNLKWGMLATALLADLDSEARKKN